MIKVKYHYLLNSKLFFLVIIGLLIVTLSNIIRVLHWLIKMFHKR